jgi:hypothetical protein
MWELGRYPLFSNALQRFVNYYDRLLTADSATYLCRAFTAAQSDDRYSSLVTDLMIDPPLLSHFLFLIRHPGSPLQPHLPIRIKRGSAIP